MYSAVVFFHLQPALLQFLECLKLKPHQEFDLQPEGSETKLCKEHLFPVCSRKPRNDEWERERRFIVWPGLGDAHHLLGKMWQCPQGHPGKWPKSKQSAQTLRSLPFTSQPNLSSPPSPGPTVSTEKSRLLVILLPVTGPIRGPWGMQGTHSFQALHREQARAGAGADTWTLL